MPSVHYCQRCDSNQPLRPVESGRAQCPTCGGVDIAAFRLPLLVLTGASGSGKSTLLPLLLDQLRGRCAVFDVDWLIDPLGGTADIDWRVFRDTWLHVVHAVAQNGLPTLLLGPLTPEHLDDMPGRAWVGEIHFAVLDCQPEHRRSRITGRPAWRVRDIDEQQGFADWLRTNLAPVFDSGASTPQETATAVAAWVRMTLESNND